ncbi:arylsulfatase [Aquibacillus sediminis]|uniref:arylsulfatase n=1 Tax=Aquibacillus sediminis TaxID=2574734 RepID=UPI0011097B5B|nr:arylsulfatase [Aquibacillus sediminis]
MKLGLLDVSWSPLKKFTATATTLALLSGCANGEASATADNNEGKANSNNNQTKISRDADINVAYIVLDDSGFSDLASYGSEIATPNMDWLADNGLRYNNFHVNPTCSPTRSALLTGRNHHAVGMATVANFDLGSDYPNKRGQINPEAATIAEVLGEQGINNYALGKWHLSPSHQATQAGPYHNWPLGKGFDRFYGFLEDSTDQFKPEMVNDNTFVDVTDEEDLHLSEVIVDQANQYVTDHVSINAEKPFFVSLNFGAQHQPVQVPDEYIDMYKGKYDQGWDVIRKERFERQKELGIIPEDAEFVDRNPDVQPWDELTQDQKKAFARFQEAYAGFLTHTDEQIGRFIDHLRSVGELENTMIVLLSDNGASPLGGENGSVNHTLTFNVMDQDMEQIMDQYDDIGTEKAKVEFPSGWAQVSNTPFKMYKATAYEAGIRSPLIVYNPIVIEDNGGVRDQYIHVSDITPTVYDLLGIELPKEVNGVKQMPLHGESFLDTFTDSSAEGKTTQYYEHNGQRAIYENGWKAIANHQLGQPFEEDIWELYHVEEDVTENNNLAKAKQKKLKQMQKQFDREAKKYDVLPMSDTGPDGFTSVPEDTLRAKSQFTFYPGMSHLPEGASPFTINNSHSITVPIDRESNSDEGVLVALGGYQSGYTFYIDDNRLVYEYNMGNAIYRVESDVEVPVGEATVAMEFQKTGDYQGNATLSINGDQVGKGEIAQTHPFKLSFEGLDVGKDLLYPVSPAYEEEGTFEFTGEIEKVEYDIQEN